MESYFSILRFVNNPVSNESIAVGLIFISQDQVYFKYSQQKINFVKKLNPAISKLFDFSIAQLSSYIKKDSLVSSDLLFQFPKNINANFLNRLADYNNGILQFSKLSFIKENVDQEIFLDYFKKFINNSVVEQKQLHIDHPFPLNLKIEKSFCVPLKDKIDINYTLKKKSLPSLFFDFKFDGIGFNGSMYAAKSIDFNSNKSLPQIKTEISEFESVIERLNKFAESKNIFNKNPQYNLIVDPYTGNSPSTSDLYSLLKEENMPFFKLISSDDIDELVKQIIKQKIHKFSELIPA
jgi:hypothetical protein